MEYVDCAICGVDNTKLVFSGPDRAFPTDEVFSVVQCTNCGLIYTNPRPSKNEIIKYYPDNYAPYSPYENSLVELFSKREKLFDKIRNEIKYNVFAIYYGYSEIVAEQRIRQFSLLPETIKKVILKLFLKKIKNQYYKIPNWRHKGKALDVGCGNGAYLHLLKNLGWDVTGVDFINNLNPELHNIEVKFLESEGDLLNDLKQSFNFISMWHVLEHLRNPQTTLKNIYDLLDKDGVLYIEIPNQKSLPRILFKRNWFAWELPRHLYHFSPATIEKLLINAKFRKVQIKHLNKTTFLKSLSYLLDEGGYSVTVSEMDNLVKKIYALKILQKILGLAFRSVKASDIVFVRAIK